MKIAKLELENVKRVRAVEFEPAPDGLTVIGGKNGQGKTSILDAIAWALGGEKYRPSSAQNDASVLPPRLHVVLDNGIVVDRDGKNSSLKVTDPSGKRAGQQLLDTFVEKFALDLPKFLNQNSKEKASTLLKIIGMESVIAELDDKEKSLYNRRHALGQIADQKRKYANELPSYLDVPNELLSATELIQQQQMIISRNAENQRKRDKSKELLSMKEKLSFELSQLEEKLHDLSSLIQEKNIQLSDCVNKLDNALAEESVLFDESTEDVEDQLFKIEEINSKVRANLEKEKASSEANDIVNQYESLTGEIENVRSERIKLLSEANLPLPGLSVEDGELLYKDKRWDCMSSSEQMIVSVAIVRSLNPNCGFVLLDKMEQFDLDTLNEFGVWLEKEGLQAICTRVSTGDECEIIIEDGVSKVKKQVSKKKVESSVSSEELNSSENKTWKAGVF